nr:type II secretion system protein N [Yersinia similis]
MFLLKIRLKNPFRKFTCNQFIFIELSIIFLVVFHTVMVFWSIIYNDSNDMFILYDGQAYDSQNSTEKTKVIDSSKLSKMFERKIKKPDKEMEMNDVLFYSPEYIGEIKLVGVVEHSEPSESIAILEINGKQKIYLTRENIEYEDIVIVRIFTDRVIIKYAGKYYSLIIY